MPPALFSDTPRNVSRHTRPPWPLALAAIALAAALFPGDAPFISDEPHLVALALAANAAGQPATVGLAGSMGVPYGPAGVWAIQLLLLLTHDPLTLMSLRAGLFMAVLAGSLYWLSRSAGLGRWGPLAVMASPYVWLYARQLWDNTLLIPLGTLALACYAAHLTRGRLLPLAAGVLLASLGLLVHLMAAPLLAAMLLHLPLRRAPARCYAIAIAALAVTATLGAGYWPTLLHAAPSSHHTTDWLFPVLGPRLLTAWHLDYFFTNPPAYLHSAGTWSTAFAACATLTLLAFPAALLGAIRPRPITTVALLTIALAGLQSLIAGAHGHPHYYNGAFAAWAVLFCIGLARLPRIVAPLPAAACAVATLLLLTRLHTTAGTRDLGYGATLAQQIQAADALTPAHFDNQTAVQGDSIRALQQLRNRHGSATTLRYTDADTARLGSPKSARLTTTP